MALKTKPRPAPAAAPVAKKQTKKRGTSTENTWWAQAEDVPRAGLEDAEQLHKKARRWRRCIKATLILAPLALLASIVAIGSALNVEVPVDPNIGKDIYADSRPVAQVALTEWLDADPQPLPGGDLVAWVRAERDSYEPPAEESDDPVITVDVHEFSVAAADGTLFTAVVPVQEIDGVYTVAAAPSLQPTVPLDDSTAVLWPNTPDSEASDAVEQVITAWAEAFTSGQPEQLRLAVQDPDPNHTYVPLTGLDFYDIAVEQAGVWGSTDASANDNAAADIIVNVTMTAMWASDPYDPNVSDIEPQSFSYDLLVQGADTAAPVVVAWGGAGQGPLLEPYMNAVEGIEIIPGPLPEVPEVEETDKGKGKKDKEPETVSGVPGTETTDTTVTDGETADTEPTDETEDPGEEISE